MKNIIILFVISLIFTNCKAQIIPRYGSEPYGEIDGAYYKDVNNELNPFEGTWLYTTLNDTLKVTFVKKYHFDRGEFFTDYLIGEFQYVEDGIEKANTLSNINVNHSSIFDYNMYSIAFVKKFAFPVCNDCTLADKRLVMHFDEPANDDSLLDANFIMRHVIENGVEKLKVQFIMISSADGINKDSNSNEPSTAERHSIPYGEYTLIKQ